MTRIQGKMAAVPPAVEAQAASFADELCAGGFDLFMPMRVSWYNDYLKSLAEVA